MRGERGDHESPSESKFRKDSRVLEWHFVCKARDGRRQSELELQKRGFASREAEFGAKRRRCVAVGISETHA